VSGLWVCISSAGLCTLAATLVLAEAPGLQGERPQPSRRQMDGAGRACGTLPEQHPAPGPGCGWPRGDVYVVLLYLRLLRARQGEDVVEHR